MLLHHEVSGEGAPLILLHGLLGSSRNLGMVARELSEYFQVCSVDLPNHGKSPRSTECGFAVLADAVHAVAESLDWQRYSLLGHSLGGKVAMRLALEHAHSVDRLLVEDIAPVDYPPHHTGILEAMRSIQLEALESRSEAKGMLMDKLDDEPTVNFIVQNLRGRKGGFYWLADLDNISACYPSYCLRPFESAEGDAFNGPTLFVGGGRSNYIQAEHQSAIKASFPNAKYRQIEGAGHVIHAEKPALFASVAKRFFIKQ